MEEQRRAEGGKYLSVGRWIKSAEKMLEREQIM